MLDLHCKRICAGETYTPLATLDRYSLQVIHGAAWGGHCKSTAMKFPEVLAQVRTTDNSLVSKVKNAIKGPKEVCEMR